MLVITQITIYLHKKYNSATKYSRSLGFFITGLSWEVQGQLISDSTWWFG